MHCFNSFRAAGVFINALSEHGHFQDNGEEVPSSNAVYVFPTAARITNEQQVGSHCYFCTYCIMEMAVFPLPMIVFTLSFMQWHAAFLLAS